MSHFLTLHYLTSRYIALPYIILPYITLYYLSLQCIALHIKHDINTSVITSTDDTIQHNSAPQYNTREDKYKDMYKYKYNTLQYNTAQYHTTQYSIVEGSLEVKLPTIWTDEKQGREEAERRERLEEKKSRRERVRRKKMQMREKVGKSRNTVFFQ